MNFNYKSKRGFTLIELLVVIGILAVLAAIAIPSVAGLIDRANVSADNTNATEMTNAIERFTSEYELYKQDLSSNLIDVTNLDASNSRVFNVTGIASRADVEKIESSTGLNGKGINIDTKYPVNEATFKAVVQNYMKTTSSTFEPKQSDMSYYYSPEVGIVTVAKAGSTVNEINGVVFDEETVYKFNTELATMPNGVTVHWLNMSLNANTDTPVANIMATDTKGVYAQPAIVLESEVSVPVIKHNGTIPEGGKYYKYISNENYEPAITSGEFPTVNNGDMYIYNDYAYCYNGNTVNEPRSQNIFKSFGCNGKNNGWVVRYIGSNETTAPEIISEINGKPVNSMEYTFYNYCDLVNIPDIPNSVTNMTYTFFNCTSLTTAPKIPDSVTNMISTFEKCTSLTTAPKIPDSITNMMSAFFNCTSLVTAPTIPFNVTNMNSTFFNCTSLVTAPVIPSSVTNVMSTFSGCTSLKGDITININVGTYSNNCFKDCAQDANHTITIKGSCSDEIKNAIKETAFNNGTYVTVQ